LETNSSERSFTFDVCQRRFLSVWPMPVLTRAQIDSSYYSKDAFKQKTSSLIRLPDTASGAKASVQEVPKILSPPKEIAMASRNLDETPAMVIDNTANASECRGTKRLEPEEPSTVPAAKRHGKPRIRSKGQTMFIPKKCK